MNRLEELLAYGPLDDVCGDVGEHLGFNPDGSLARDYWILVRIRDICFEKLGPLVNNKKLFGQDDIGLETLHLTKAFISYLLWMGGRPNLSIVGEDALGELAGEGLNPEDAESTLATALQLIASYHLQELDILSSGQGRPTGFSRTLSVEPVVADGEGLELEFGCVVSDLSVSRILSLDALVTIALGVYPFIEPKNLVRWLELGAHRSCGWRDPDWLKSMPHPFQRLQKSEEVNGPLVKVGFGTPQAWHDLHEAWLSYSR